MGLPSLAAAISLAVAWAPPGALASSNQANGAASAIMASISVSTASGPISGMPTDLVGARDAVLAGNYTSRLHHQGRDRCPSSCSSAGVDTTAWYVYGSLNRLRRACSKTMLLDFALFNQIDGTKAHVAISACTADLGSTTSGTGSSISGSAATCVAEEVQQATATSSVQLASSGVASSAHAADVAAALDQLRAYSSLGDAACNETIKYAYTGNIAVGVYAGSGLANQGVLSSVLEKLSSQVKSDGSVAESLVVQMCSNSSARYSLGILANTKGDLGAVQRGLQSWKNGSCVAMDTSVPTWQIVAYLAPALLQSGLNSSATNATNSSSINPAARPRWSPVKRVVSSRDTTCRTIQVAAGDECASLAAECGITPAQFTTYNPSPNLCSSLIPGQHVCCSAGTLPDFLPKPEADGYCYAYLVQTGDTCSFLAASYDLTTDKIEQYNSNTWGWNGCAKLFADYYICLSSGYPPMPATVPNAVCGPQVNNTAKAPPGADLSTLNECPLNACCDVWGQCGTTTEFCTTSQSATGAPGTAADGANGCISNCGTNIIGSSAPSQTYRIAYFEAFDWQRSCLRMSVTSIDTSAYTHIHFSFITLNPDFSINTNDVANQLPLFRGMAGVKKIVSVGGWTFSTDPGTYTIFRNAVASNANRQTLVTNVINFLNEYNLDGIDWDWEYPDEPDIPGIPAGTAAESIGFFLLLDQLKLQMPAGKTVSITAPASFWYLQYFPIQALSLVVDYVVLMTYDLHGQWDYINKYADPGCPSYDQGLGNCLRSHVNISETINALSMITKAGVPSNMIAVGVSSYGRSFQMTTPGCWTEQCTFTGPESGAYPGPCTNTAGYISDYEIGLILKQNPSSQDLFDSTSYSNVLVFNNTQWVAYMDDDNKVFREGLYQGIGFLGTADWAVDLQSDSGTGDGSGDSDSSSTIYVDPGIWNSPTPLVTALPCATLVWPPLPLHSTTTIAFDPWTTTISYSSLTTLTSTLAGGALTTYPDYVYVSWLTVLTIPPVVTTEIAVWGISLACGATGGSIVLSSSVQPPPFTVVITPVISGTTSIIGATKTTTSSAAPVIWGSITYTPPVETETLGGLTTIIGGRTQPPTVVTVTPNPHPTTTPSTTDPVLNPKKTSWTSGKPASPTNTGGCPGCGKTCHLFCDPGCPGCPPGVFGSDGGGEDGDNDDDRDEDPTATYTGIYNILTDDVYPTVLIAANIASSLDSVINSLVQSVFTTSTPPPPPPPTSTQGPPPPPTPTADCIFLDAYFFLVFDVFNIAGWGGDDGAALKTQESGCGGLSGWTEKSPTEFIFDLTYFIKAGCVERAIVSAGGPKIQCQFEGTVDSKKAREAGSTSLRARLDVPRGLNGTKLPPDFPPYTNEELQEIAEFYRSTQPTTAPHTGYVPMTWEATSPTPQPTETLPRLFRRGL
ncbi:killer toxin subunits alpha/beta [Phialemonium atrogriseum]|uniref:chitinase n=1 Tax=Phialemonium atrogriseum TaxID=1093897 RepID=A0AAJ0C083_9PEZI|nr:killer toxin subunits alpha/beta [Phialemonium atrogriseum]KAK1766312.1 killer toxin subunits alpha/beta [Phialemonium atrogriseum]